MIAVIQRVKKAHVQINNRITAQIKNGYLILIGFCQEDNQEKVKKMAEKIANLRIMADENGKMNLNISQVNGEILLVSQFTLCADTSQRRPSFTNALSPDQAKKLYYLLIDLLTKKNIPVKTGKFGHYMTVELINDGPTTIIFKI